MTQFAYAAAQAPGPAEQHPLGVVTPMNKIQQWWDLDWMHRESFFLPRYDCKWSVPCPIDGWRYCPAQRLSISFPTVAHHRDSGDFWAGILEK